jgi:peptide/nickel transport system substrate-binding protein
MAPYFIYHNYLDSKATDKVGGTATTNVARVSDPSVDQAILDIASTNDTTKQKAAYKTIQDYLVDELPYIPLYVNQALTEFNTTHATGWPTEDNLYAFPEPWKSWDNGIVLKTIRPAN